RAASGGAGQRPKKVNKTRRSSSATIEVTRTVLYGSRKGKVSGVVEQITQIWASRANYSYPCARGSSACGPGEQERPALLPALKWLELTADFVDWPVPRNLQRFVRALSTRVLLHRFRRGSLRLERASRGQTEQNPASRTRQVTLPEARAASTFRC